MASCRGLVATASPQAPQSFLSIVSGTADALGAGQRHGCRGVTGRLPSAQDKERSHVKACPHRRCVRRGLPVVLHRKEAAGTSARNEARHSGGGDFWPYFLNEWIPLEGMSHEQYLTTKFGSPEAYKDIAQRVMAAAAAKGSSGRAASIANRTPAMRIASSAGRKQLAKRLR